MHFNDNNSHCQVVFSQHMYHQSKIRGFLSSNAHPSHWPCSNHAIAPEPEVVMRALSWQTCPLRHP